MNVKKICPHTPHFVLTFLLGDVRSFNRYSISGRAKKYFLFRLFQIGCRAGLASYQAGTGGFFSWVEGLLRQCNATIQMRGGISPFPHKPLWLSDKRNVGTALPFYWYTKLQKSFSTEICLNLKIIFTLENVTKTQRGSRGIALLFL